MEGSISITAFNPLLTANCENEILTEFSPYENGRSCHHCRSRKRNDFMTFCTKLHPGKNSTKRCRKQYCNNCLRKHYNLITFECKEGKYLLPLTEKLEEIIFKAEKIYSNTNVPQFELFRDHDIYLPNILKCIITEEEFLKAIPIHTWCCGTCIKIEKIYSESKLIPASINFIKSPKSSGDSSPKNSTSKSTSRSNSPHSGCFSSKFSTPITPSPSSSIVAPNYKTTSTNLISKPFVKIPLARRFNFMGFTSCSNSNNSHNSTNSCISI